jgi:hypothetical protein
MPRSRKQDGSGRENSRPLDRARLKEDGVRLLRLFCEPKGKTISQETAAKLIAVIDATEQKAIDIVRSEQKAKTRTLRPRGPRAAWRRPRARKGLLLPSLVFDALGELRNIITEQTSPGKRGRRDLTAQRQTAARLVFDLMALEPDLSQAKAAKEICAWMVEAGLPKIEPLIIEREIRRLPKRELSGLKKRLDPRPRTKPVAKAPKDSAVYQAEDEFERERLAILKQHDEERRKSPASHPRALRTLLTDDNRTKGQDF